MAGKSKEARELVREMKKWADWEYMGQSGKHHKFRYLPTGVRVTVPISPSDHRWLKNMRSQIRNVERGMRFTD